MKRQTFFAKQGDLTRQWRITDADGQSLGRLASDIALVLMGKHRPEYTPHIDTGDFVVVVNASKVGLTGRKAEQSTRMRYTRHPSGHKTESFGEIRQKHPERLVEDAVRRMLPKNRLGRVMLAKLRVYPGVEHPHQSQTLIPM